MSDPGIITTLLSYLVAISILVAIHEFGHFWVARRLGIKVLRFSIGFGRVLWSRMGADGTEYALSAIPLGGYVRMLDEREDGVTPQDLTRAFNRQPVWKRILVLLAGPGFNFIFAILAYWVLLQIGVPSMMPVAGDITPHSFAADAGLRKGDLIKRVNGNDVATQEAAVLGILRAVISDDGVVDLQVVGKDRSERDVRLVTTGHSQELTQPDALLSGLGFDFWYPVPAVIGKFAEVSPAKKAGLMEGDQILRFDGQTIDDFIQLVKVVEPRGNRTVDVEVRRNGEYRTFSLDVGQEFDQKGKAVGRIGIHPAPFVTPDDLRSVQRYNAFSALPRAVEKTYQTCTLTVSVLGKIITGRVSLKSISGPVGIAKATGYAVSLGLVPFLTILALISTSIGVLNLLPVPILDGGQIVYQLAELLKGGPVSERAQALGQQLGFVLLILLMLLATYNDVMPHLG